jgi:hypothetical protein
LKQRRVRLARSARIENHSFVARVISQLFISREAF